MTEPIQPGEAERRLRELERKRRELAAMVMHDLRNPLSAIVGHLELLRSELGADGRPLPAAIGDLEALAQHALAMLATLLDVEELEEGVLVAHREEVEVDELIDHLVRPYRRRLAARGLTLAVASPAGARASLDRDLIGRVIENLLDNSVRYAERRGRVDLAVERRPDALIVRIGNDGPPVPDEDRPRLFDRYYRIEARRAAARENRGLGLYFCRLAVGAHGGTIEIDGTAELPAIFVVTLPQSA